MRNRLNIVVRVHREQNEFGLACSVKRALRKAGVPRKLIKKVRNLALAEGNTRKDVKRILGRFVDLRFVKSIVRVAMVVDGGDSGLHHWAARWRSPHDGTIRKQCFHCSTEEIQEGWPEGWKVVFVDPGGVE